MAYKSIYSIKSLTEQPENFSKTVSAGAQKAPYDVHSDDLNGSSDDSSKYGEKSMSNVSTKSSLSTKSSVSVQSLKKGERVATMDGNGIVYDNESSGNTRKIQYTGAGHVYPSGKIVDVPFAKIAQVKRGGKWFNVEENLYTSKSIQTNESTKMTTVSFAKAGGIPVQQLVKGDKIRMNDGMTGEVFGSKCKKMTCMVHVGADFGDEYTARIAEVYRNGQWVEVDHTNTSPIPEGFRSMTRAAQRAFMKGYNDGLKEYKPADVQFSKTGTHVNDIKKGDRVWLSGSGLAATVLDDQQDSRGMRLIQMVGGAIRKEPFKIPVYHFEKVKHNGVISDVVEGFSTTPDWKNTPYPKNP